MCAAEAKKRYRDDQRGRALFQCRACGAGYTASRKHLSLRLALNWPRCNCTNIANSLEQIPNQTPGVLIVGKI